MKPKLVLPVVVLVLAALTVSAQTGGPTKVTGKPKRTASGVQYWDITPGNGHVLANETVSVQFHVPQVSELQILEGKTGGDGTVRFRLPEPVPPKVTILAMNERLYPCSSRLPLESQSLIHEGLVSRCSKPMQGCRCKFSSQVSQTQKRPGELVLLARPLTGWEKFLGRIWE